MLDNLDIRTLSIIALVSNLLLAFAMHLADYVWRDDPAVRAWKWGAAQLALGLCLLAMDGMAPYLVTAVLNKSLMAAGVAWTHFGLRYHLGLPRGRRLDVVAGLVIGLSSFYYAYLDRDLAMRIQVALIGYAVLSLLSAHLLLFTSAARKAANRVALTLLGVAYLVSGLCFGLVAASTRLSAPTANLMHIDDPMLKSVFIVYVAMNIALLYCTIYVTAYRYHRELRDSEEKLRTALSCSPNAIFLVSPEGRFTYSNQQATRLLGYSDGELLNMDIAETLAEKLRDRGLAAFRDNLAGRQQSFETVMLDKGGQRIDVEINGVRLPDGNVLAEVRDITQIKRNQAELDRYRHDLETLVRQRTDELTHSEARATSILESSAAGIYGTNRDDVITFINPAACALLGYSDARAVGQKADQLLRPGTADGRDARHADSASVRALRDGLKTRVDDGVLLRADGRRIPVMFDVHPIFHDGEIEGAVTSFVDMTEQREAALAREQALVAAENLARIRREFLANMSHEIRTPLNGVLGFAEIGYRNHRDAERARDAFAKIRTSGQLLLSVIDEILDFSKIEAGKLRLENTLVVLPEVITQAVQLVQDKANAKGLELTVELAPDLPATCVSDPLRIGQLLLNLLSNAVKFTPAGSIYLRVKRADRRLLFAVTDTGIGIDDEQLEVIFNPFLQADGSTTRRFGGTGLGLAICKHILALMGGDITVESRPGVGSRFEFWLPYHEADHNAPQPAQPPEFARNDSLPPLHGINILVAEDDEINQLVLEENLRTDGARIDIVANGRLAVDLVARKGGDAYDIVLMDIQMPEMDGYAATAHILALAPGLPIIGQTAHALPEERQKCLAAGMVAHIAKPIVPDALVALVLRHCRRKSGADSR